MRLFFIISLNFILTICDDCGPLGFRANQLLSPAYWFFDLNAEKCPILPTFPDEKEVNLTCRIYFNLCKNMPYQCSGAVCARYIETIDYVTMLGKYDTGVHPFREEQTNAEGNHVPFEAEYTGEELPCGSLKPVKTIFSFFCNKTAQWNISIVNLHGGSRASNLRNVNFNNITCQFDIQFDSSEACEFVPAGEQKGSSISYGSIILILFFPGLALYFILGALFNRMRGFEGKDMIPHRTFWVDLPDLIMDGFIFSMATITCRHEDRYSKEYDPLS